jgi:hypothetical protein
MTSAAAAAAARSRGGADDGGPVVLVSEVVAGLQNHGATLGGVHEAELAGLQGSANVGAEVDYRFACEKVSGVSRREIEKERTGRH